MSGTDFNLASRPGRGGLIAAGVLLAVLAMWALWPIRPAVFAPLDAAPIPDSTSAGAVPTPTLDLAAFDRPVFTIAAPPELPKPAAAPPPPPLPPPLKLQLLAIEKLGDGFRAVLYDPDADKVVTVASGNTVAGRTVARVAAEGVVLSLGSLEQPLLLRADRPIDSSRERNGGDR